MATPRTVDYRHVREGFGGTFSSYALRPAIGTRNCMTCVGVYFPVNDQQCFLAHINAAIIPSDYMTYLDNNRNTYKCPRICENDEGEKIRMKVLERLKQAAKAGRWKASEVHKSQVIIVCSKYNDNEAIVSKFVVKGLKEFLNMGDELVVHVDCHGFVVDPTGGPPLLLEDKNYLGGIDAYGEAKNGLWQQMVGGVMYRFGAEDMPTTGMQNWTVFLEDGAVPMAKRKVLEPDVDGDSV